MSASSTEVSQEVASAKKNLASQVETNRLVLESARDMMKLADQVKELVAQFDKFKWDKGDQSGSVHDAAYQRFVSREAA
jgi:hypothetical protein